MPGLRVGGVLGEDLGGTPGTPGPLPTPDPTPDPIPDPEPEPVPDPVPEPDPGPGGSTVAPLGSTGTFSLLLSDDFAGTSLDTSKWDTSGSWAADAGRGNHNNGQREWMTPSANFSFANSVLTIHATRGVVQPGYSWTSGQIASVADFNSAWIEMRARFPSLRGFLAAFWTWGAGASPSTAEVDVEEFYSDNHDAVYLTPHVPGGTGGRTIDPAFDPSAGFHVWGADIKPSSIDWYIDGVLVHTSGGHPASRWNVIAYLTVNDDGTETILNRAPAPLAGTNAETMDIDYIRVWERTTTPTPPPGVAVSPGMNVQALIDAHPGGTTFNFAPGTYPLSAYLIPKSYDRFVSVVPRAAIFTGSGTNNAGWRGTSGPAGQHHVTLDGIVVTGMAPANVAPFVGAVQCGDVWTVNNCLIYGNTQIGLTANVGGTYTNNTIHTNGRYGINGGPAANTMLFLNNHVYNNNTAHYPIGNAGGTKIIRSANVIWRANSIHDNYGAGIHGDSGNSSWVIEDNDLNDNFTFGVSFECSSGAIIRNNRLAGNCLTALGQSLFFGADIYLNDGKNAEIYGNIIDAGVHGIGLRDDPGRGSEPETGINEVRNVYVHDNTVTLPTGGQCGMVGGARPDAYLPANMVRFVGNDYFVPIVTDQHWRWNIDKTFSQWQAIPQDATGTVAVG